MTSNKLYCRFCAHTFTCSKGKLIDLNNSQTLVHYKNIFSLLNVKFVDLDDEYLPKTVCTPCSYSIKRSFIFFEKAMKAQEILLQIFTIKSEEIKVKFEVDSVNDSCPSVSKFKTTSDGEVKSEISTEPNHLLVSQLETIPSKANQVDSDLKYQETDNLDQNSDNEIEKEKPILRRLRQTSTKRNFSDDTLLKKKRAHTYEDSDDIFTTSDTAPDYLEGFDDDIDFLKNKKYTKVSKHKQTKKLASKKEPAITLDCSSDYDSGNEEYSWADYKWYCAVCNETLKNMDELRDHSKAIHNLCFAFKCNDCTDEFNIFGNFIEHVRTHRGSLRKHCYFCNEKFADTASCNQHSIEHWLKNPICGLCGEIFPDDASLQRHKTAFKRKGVSRSFRRKVGNAKEVEYDVSKSWRDYEWICTYCYLEAPSVEALRLHSRKVHKECFTMKCADCFKVSIHFKTFVSHVQLHRPHLQRYCQLCDLQCANSEDVKKHLKDHSPFCSSCGQVFDNSHDLFDHIQQFNANIVNKSEKIIPCTMCKKTFPTASQLRSHLNVHQDSKQFVCETCGMGFNHRRNLLAHIRIHTPTDMQCLVCNKIFKGAASLKQHVKTHVQGEHPCDKCGKYFANHRYLKRHLQVTHSDVAEYKCEYCDKAFKLKTALRTHQRLHTGEKPYSCHYCGTSFVDWGNCDKHMKLKHNATLAKSKRTPQGTVLLDSAGNPLPLSSTEDVKEWAGKLLEYKKKGMKPKETAVPFPS